MYHSCKGYTSRETKHSLRRILKNTKIRLGSKNWTIKSPWWEVPFHFKNIWYSEWHCIEWKYYGIRYEEAFLWTTRRISIHSGCIHSKKTEKPSPSLKNKSSLQVNPLMHNVYKWPHVSRYLSNKTDDFLLRKCDHFVTLCIKGLTYLSSVQIYIISVLLSLSSTAKL